MTEKVKTGEGEVTTAELLEKIEDLDVKQADLNKGIAKYRDDAKLSKKESADLKDLVSELQEKLDNKDENLGENQDELHPDDVKKISTYLKSIGVVTKEDLDSQKKTEKASSRKQLRTDAVNNFLQANPEYDDDESWAEFQTEFALYKEPTTLDAYNKLFNRIKEDLTGDGDKIRRAQDKTRADLSNKSRLSLGGGPQGGSDKTDRIADLQKKYPNLSKDQITDRVSELDEILKEEKK